jgi:quinolinate synthase
MADSNFINTGVSQDALVEKILRLKRERDALFLVHNYQSLEIQRLADILGDSLQLSQEATRTQKPLIVFCGVHFMAESAKILNPTKKVLLPSQDAGCPMADMIDAEGLRKFKAEHPGAVVVTYVNSSAEVKAESDICCTSANAIRVVRSLGKKKILFVPDKNLAAYTKKMTGADIIPWHGFCFVHERFKRRDVEAARKQYPGAVVIVHPECPLEVSEAADEVASTSGIIRFVEQSDKKEFIIGTEQGLIDRLSEEHPDKKLHTLKENAICKNMKKTTLARLAESLEKDQYEITVPGDVREKAYRSLERMVSL